MELKKFDPKTDERWKLIFGGVDLVGASMEHSSEVTGVLMEEFHSFLQTAGYFNKAPFSWINFIVRYGLKNDRTTDYNGRISKKYGDIPLAKELDMRVLLTADENDVGMLKDFFEIAALDAMIDAGKKYKLKTKALEERRAQLGQIPDWKFEMDEHPEILLNQYRESVPK